MKRMPGRGEYVSVSNYVGNGEATPSPVICIFHNGGEYCDTIII